MGNIETVQGKIEWLLKKQISHSRLRLGWMNVKPSDVVEVCEAIKNYDSIFSNLTALDIERIVFNPEAIQHLIAANFNSLTELYFEFNQIGSQGLKYLATAPFTKLKYLYITYNNVGVAVRYLENNMFTNLLSLNLQSNQICSNGVRHMVKGSFKNLESLALAYNKVGSQGARYIANADFPHLKQLNLADNHILAIGIWSTLQGSFMRLKILIICRNSIGSEGAKLLINNQWGILKEVHSNGNNIMEQLKWFLKMSNLVKENGEVMSISL